MLWKGYVMIGDSEDSHKCPIGRQTRQGHGQRLTAAGQNANGEA
jgi:hypothetical protein